VLEEEEIQRVIKRKKKSMIRRKKQLKEMIVEKGTKKKIPKDTLTEGIEKEVIVMTKPRDLMIKIREKMIEMAGEEVEILSLSKGFIIF
jgi:hypothetical protein